MPPPVFGDLLGVTVGCIRRSKTVASRTCLESLGKSNSKSIVISTLQWAAIRGRYRVFEE